MRLLLSASFHFISLRTIVLISIFWLYSFNDYKRWTDYNPIQWDVLQYYSYLPATFYKHDLSFEFIKAEPADSHWRKLWVNPLDEGGSTIKMTMGLSILYLPFFIIAHFLAGWLGYLQDGFSLPYQILLCLSPIVYAFIGLLFLRKMLLRYFDDLIVALTLFAITIGTNFWSGILLEPGMGHPYLFMLISLFLWLFLKWKDRPGLLLAASMGLLTGLIVLIRPTNILVLLIPLLLEVRSKEEFHARILLLRSHLPQLAMAAICMFLIFIPQLMHWKHMSGHWLLYSYDKETFHFLKPHLLSGLFSYRKGWLLYTPLMLFALAGIFLLRRYARGISWLIYAFIPLNIWIVLSWWCWWYGGCFGMRPMIESYALLAFPLAAFAKLLLEKRSWFSHSLLGIILAGCLWLNIYQSNQYKTGLLHYDSMSRALYFDIFGNTNWPANYSDKMRPPTVKDGAWEDPGKIEVF